MATKTQREKAAEEAEKAAQEDPLANLSDENANAFVATLLEDAEKLGDEKRDLLERIDSNRGALRLVAKTGHLSEKQAAAIKLWYPERQAKKADENGDGPANAEAPANPETATA